MKGHLSVHKSSFDFTTARERSMLTLGIPAIVVGITAAIILALVVAAANLLQKFLWQTLPASFGATAATWWWVLSVLTLTGLVVGSIVRFVPGHAGPDPATIELFGEPTPLFVLPGLVLALVIALAGGVSLGPENPIIATIVGIVVAVGTRLIPRVPAKSWVMFAAAGTIGAMFGTPVAAALLFSEMVATGNKDKPVWDQLFGPLVAAGAGGLTMAQFEELSFALPIQPYTQPTLTDIGVGILVAIAAVAIGMIAVWLFPIFHRLFKSMGNVVLAMTVGGFLLGLLGILGGPITMFKGLGEMKLLTTSAGDYSISAMAMVIVIKLVAILVSATCGFRGGRIFPMVFVGVAFGLLVHQVFPSVPGALTVACSVLGFTLVVTRDGWLSLFMGVVMIPGTELLPLLCVAVLPIWLLLAGRPLMLVEPEPDATPPKAG
ncbi:ion channel protein [Variovorax sp. J22R24]|uniref:ion channel protein n=1 Tax=Variovorax gracilis TaxID=3053502 RepID=UPI002577B21A|nr:ion channel protein [Variovorax sp. J22R24]MDM0108408.1 ion channel protein [Variovorax sp. J22R24]